MIENCEEMLKEMMEEERSNQTLKNEIVYDCSLMIRLLNIDITSINDFIVSNDAVLMINTLIYDMTDIMFENDKKRILKKYNCFLRCLIKFFEKFGKYVKIEYYYDKVDMLFKSFEMQFVICAIYSKEMKNDGKNK